MTTLTQEGALINTHIPMQLSGMDYYYHENHESDLKEFRSLTSNPLKILGNFVGEWGGDLEEASKTATKFIYVEEYGDSLFHVKNLSPYNTFNRMPELLGYKKESYTSQIQLLRPGCSVCRHIDTRAIFDCIIPDKNINRDWQYPDQAIRVLVMLAGWEYGQLFGFNNTVFTKWEIGTIITCDFLNTWHFASNSSWHTIPILQISGIPENSLKDLVKQNQTTIINI